MPNLGVRSEGKERTRYKVCWDDDDDPRATAQEEQPSSSSAAVWRTPPVNQSSAQPSSSEHSWSTSWPNQPSSSSSQVDPWKDYRRRASSSYDEWRSENPQHSASNDDWDHQWSYTSANQDRGNRWDATSSNSRWTGDRWTTPSSYHRWKEDCWTDYHPDEAWEGEWQPSSTRDDWETEWKPTPDGSAWEEDWQPSSSCNAWNGEHREVGASSRWDDKGRTENSPAEPQPSATGVQVAASSVPSSPQNSEEAPGHVWEHEWTTTIPQPQPDHTSTSTAANPSSGHDDADDLDPPWAPRSSEPQVKMLRVECRARSDSPRVRRLSPQSCNVTPAQVCEAADSGSHIGVHFPEVIAVSQVGKVEGQEEMPGYSPEVHKLAEAGFTPNIEELLANLTGPLEVVHQVSPSEVKRHLERWASAAQDEVDSLEGMQAIKRHRGQAAQRLIRDPSVEVLPAKGVFTVKPGKPFRRKVRVVSCGNFAKTIAEDVLYASGAAAETLRTILVYAGSKRRSAWATDIKNAFLLAPIPGTATKKYALKPPAILILLGICDPSEIWEVCWALYGFKEAPKWWSQYRDDVLSQAQITTPLGLARLQRTISDDNLWKLILEDNSCIAHVLVYVDDLLILAEQPVAEAVYNWVKGQWQCSELEQAHVHKPLRFLGVDLYEVRDEVGVCGFALAQEGYIDELVRSHGLSSCARATVPVPKDWVKDAPAEERGYEEGVLRDAQRITGELLWVSQRTRIDISFGVGLMSSWTVRSPEFVTKLGLRILAYLARTRELRLILTPCPDKDLDIFTDASFAPFSERSISGIVVQLRGRSIFWKSRKQTLVSLSTAESELIAACEGSYSDNRSMP